MIRFKTKAMLIREPDFSNIMTCYCGSWLHPVFPPVVSGPLDRAEQQYAKNQDARSYEMTKGERGKYDTYHV